MSERLEVSSGSVLLIDQFMLGNEQFLSVARDSGLSAAVQQFGGCLLSLPNGLYGVYRDAHLQLIAVKPPQGGEIEETPEDLEELFEAFGPDASPVSQVLVDTRCLVLVDAGIIQNADVIEQYQSFREAGEDKPARDLLRSNGGAVRYGFNQYGDELAVFQLDSIIALWPQ